MTIIKQKKYRERETILVDPELSKDFKIKCFMKDVSFSDANEYGRKMAMIELDKFDDVMSKEDAIKKLEGMKRYKK